MSKDRIMNTEQKIDKLIEESIIVTGILTILTPVIAFLAHELALHGTALANGRRIASHTTKKEFLNSILKNKNTGRISPQYSTKGFTDEVFGEQLKTEKNPKNIKGIKESYNNAKGHIYMTTGKFWSDLIQRLYYTVVLNDPKKDNRVPFHKIIGLGLYYILTDPIFNTSKTKILYLDLPDDDKKIKNQYVNDPNTGMEDWALRSSKSKKVYKSRYKLLYEIITKNFKKALKEFK